MTSKQIIIDAGYIAGLNQKGVESCPNHLRGAYFTQWMHGYDIGHKVNRQRSVDAFKEYYYVGLAGIKKPVMRGAIQLGANVRSESLGPDSIPYDGQSINSYILRVITSKG